MITCPPESVEPITTTLLNKRLAAAINIVPAIQSRYWWDNAVQSSEEALLIVKTHSIRFSQIVQTVKEIHPYQVPSIILLPIISGTDEYLNWISREVKAN